MISQTFVTKQVARGLTAVFYGLLLLSLVGCDAANKKDDIKPLVGLEKIATSTPVEVAEVAPA